MGIETPKLKIDFAKGDRVKVTSGPFFDFTGVVDEIQPEKEKVRALISIFGRETPVELELGQVAQRERSVALDADERRSERRREVIARVHAQAPVQAHDHQTESCRELRVRQRRGGLGGVVRSGRRIGFVIVHRYSLHC